MIVVWPVLIAVAYWYYHTRPVIPLNASVCMMSVSLITLCIVLTLLNPLRIHPYLVLYVTSLSLWPTTQWEDHPYLNHTNKFFIVAFIAICSVLMWLSLIGYTTLRLGVVGPSTIIMVHHTFMDLVVSTLLGHRLL